MSSFAHLHVHTEYSLLDGMSRIKNLVKYNRELGMDSLAITDHGAMYGVIEFYRACKDEGVKPIIGMETYISPRDMRGRDSKLDSQNYHLLLIAQNQTGYKNLLKVASAAQLEGFYYKPRVDKDFLAAHSEGLICTSGCLAAEIPQMIVDGREKEARRVLGWYQDVFGPERFYIEVQDHDIPELHTLNKALLELSPNMGVPLLATNDVHYVRPDDATPHDVLLCIGTGSLVSDTKRLKISDNSYYLRSPQEMIDIFGEWPDAIRNTLKVAEMCEVDLDRKEYHLPNFEVPDRFDAASYLRHLCEEGLLWRFGEQAGTPELQNRLNYELDVIHGMGFDTYFLIVWDLCEFARTNDIWWNVRGSGAGSIVAYSLGITNIDPIQNGLIFERFLNPGRVSMPDIDIDYPDDRRSEMIDYCVRKYGEDKVAQIITFGTLGARAAVRDVARALDVPLNEVDQLARLIPSIPGKPVTLEEALEQVAELKAAYEDRERPYIRNLLDTAKQLEGIARHASTHAAGVLIADRPLVEYTPLNRPTRGGEGGAEGLGVVSQWPMEIVESIGLLKVDFLGLRTLTIMRKACELIEQSHGIHYDLNNIPYRHSDDDPIYNQRLDAAFELMAHGDTNGVFQVEGGGMTRVLVTMKPSRFEHIVAAISLFRPGPIEYIPAYIRRMHGEEVVSYHHPMLEPILSETYGIMVYQEQLVQVAANLFGYTLGDADLMRRAVSKKKEKDLLQHRSIFQKQGPEHGVSVEAANKIFNDIEFFARYGFNKSHAADYAVLTVQTAFLKAHYPHEYMTALLISERDNTDKLGGYINDCRRMGIAVLPPDVNSSEQDFRIVAHKDVRAIRYGLSAIKNVGDGAVEALLLARQDGPFVDAADLCQRADLRQVGKRALECLVKVGSLDALGERLSLLASVERMIGFSGNQHKAAEVGQMSLFGAATGVALTNDTSSVLISTVSGEVTRREMLQWERELIGVYISEHPLQPQLEQIQKVVTAYTSQLTEADHDRQVTMAGIVVGVRRHTTKSGKPMAFAQLEDLHGQIEVVIWPSTWDETQAVWEEDRVLLVRGKVDAGRGEPKLLCDDATTNFEVMEAHQPESSAEPAWFAPDLPDFEDFPPLNFADLSSTPPEQFYEPETYQDYEEAPSFNDSQTLHDVSAAAEPVGLLEAVEEDEQPITPLDDISVPVVSPIENESPVHLQVSIQRSGDPDRDKRKIHRLHGKLTSFHGDDHFSILLVNGDTQVEIDFPNDTTHYSEALLRELTPIIGMDAIQVRNEE